MFFLFWVFYFFLCAKNPGHIYKHQEEHSVHHPLYHVFLYSGQRVVTTRIVIEI